MTSRAERLGLEPGSIATDLEKVDARRAAEGKLRMDPSDDELRHSIAISLKRIADALERPAPVYTFDRRFGGQPS